MARDTRDTGRGRGEEGRRSRQGKRRNHDGQRGGPRQPRPTRCLPASHGAVAERQGKAEVGRNDIGPHCSLTQERTKALAIFRVRA